jgi:hypothetical protein
MSAGLPVEGKQDWRSQISDSNLFTVFHVELRRHDR